MFRLCVPGRFLAAAFAAGVATLLACGPGFAQQKPKGPAPKAPDQKAAQQKAALVQLKKEEIAALLKAFFLLAEADADYDGHRARAMGHVQHAVEAIEGGKDLFVRWERESRRRRPAIIESQGRSDAQLRQAAEVLRGVAQAMSQANQRRVLQPVKKAIAEIGIALTIR
jgi:hypothetical protein